MCRRAAQPGLPEQTCLTAPSGGSLSHEEPCPLDGRSSRELRGLLRGLRFSSPSHGSTGRGCSFSSFTCWLTGEHWGKVLHV